MLALAQLQLDHLLGDGNKPTLGHLLVVTDAIAGVGAMADETPVLVEVTKGSLGSG
jgi:hypothetical protein